MHRKDYLLRVMSPALNAIYDKSNHKESVSCISLDYNLQKCISTA